MSNKDYSYWLERVNISGADLQNVPLHFRLPDNKEDKDKLNASSESMISDSAYESGKKDRSAFSGSELSGSSSNLSGLFTQRISQKNKGFLDYSGELKSAMNFVAGQSNTLTVDHSNPSVEYYLEPGSLGLAKPLWVEDRMPSKQSGVAVMMIDTSGSVSDDLLSQFSSDAIRMAEFLVEHDGKLILCSADADLKSDSIVEIDRRNIDEFRKEGILFTGRGGTDFERSLVELGEFIEEREKKGNKGFGEVCEKISALVYLTDGEDFAPTSLPHPSLPSSINFVVPESMVDRLDTQVSSYAGVLPLKEGVVLDLGHETSQHIEMSL